MPEVELQSCGGLKANVNKREEGSQNGAGSSSMSPSSLAREFAQMNSPSSASDIRTPSSVSSSSSSSSSIPFSNSSPGAVTPHKFLIPAAPQTPQAHPAPMEQKTSMPSCVGWSTGKRRAFTAQDSPTFECGEVTQANTISKEQAEETIRGLEARYQCDLSAKKIKSDIAKAATNKSTIARLELELQMEYIRRAEYASKEGLYAYCTNMRTMAKKSEDIDPTLRSPKKGKSEAELALEELNDAQAAFMRAREKARQLGQI